MEFSSGAALVFQKTGPLGRASLGASERPTVSFLDAQRGTVLPKGAADRRTFPL
ncbi:MAG: hypothetical protein JNG88_09820 [Phycisphaerales bacterium]|nr:hypothetical protein [Phycisphaerales bacterium]